MIPNQTPVALFESTFDDGEVWSAEVDPEDLVFLMDILSKVYSDPELAVCREYITNAWDSHLEAGQTRPIEVSTPSILSPNLIIRDFGVGMDKDDIFNTYRKYARSTKRDSNLGTGMIGIGSKSAFAYSSNFTVTGIKDGYKVIVFAAREEDGSVSYRILDERKTDEGNGVTISIPVRNIDTINHKIHEVCAFFPTGAILVNGKDVSHRDRWELLGTNIKDDDGNIVATSLWVDNEKYLGNKIIMGNVAYNMTVPTHFASRLIAEVPMGSVQFEPSRESLMSTEHTNHVQNTIVEVYKDMLVAGPLKEIAEAKTYFEAYTLNNKYRQKFADINYGKVKYRGETIPGPAWYVFRNSWGSPHQDAVLSVAPFSNHSSISPSYGITYDYMSNNVKMIVTDMVHKKRYPSNDRKKVAQYLEKKLNLPVDWNTQVVFIREGHDDVLHDTKWIPEIPRVPWKDIASERLPKDPNSMQGRMLGKYHEIDDKGHLSLREIEEDEDIIYIHHGQSNEWPSHNLVGRYAVEPMVKLRKIVKYAAGEKTVLSIYGNRIEKFERDFPNATKWNYDDVVDAYRKRLCDSVDDDLLRAWAISHSSGARMLKVWLPFLPDADPDVEAIKFDPKIETGRVGRVYDRIQYTEWEKRFNDAINGVDEHVKAVLGRYPIIGISGGKVDSEAAMRYIKSDYELYLSTQEEDDEDSV